MSVERSRKKRNGRPVTVLTANCSGIFNLLKITFPHSLPFEDCKIQNVTAEIRAHAASDHQKSAILSLKPKLRTVRPSKATLQLDRSSGKIPACNLFAHSAALGKARLAKLDQSSWLAGMSLPIHTIRQQVQHHLPHSCKFIPVKWKCRHSPLSSTTYTYIHLKRQIYCNACLHTQNFCQLHNFIFSCQEKRNAISFSSFFIAKH